jgi:hypothetical protein
LFCFLQFSNANGGRKRFSEIEGNRHPLFHAGINVLAVTTEEGWGTVYDFRDNDRVYSKEIAKIGLDLPLRWRKKDKNASCNIHSPRSGFSRPQDSTRINHCWIAQIPDVSSKDGAVIGAVLSTRKFHRGHH